MIISRLEEFDKSKIKVYIDDEYAFLLYKKDIHQWELKEGAVLSQELYTLILSNLYQRCMQKALTILKFMDRSEKELYNKLHDAGYPTDIIDRIIISMKEYGYINDARFALSFIRIRMKSKSKLMIKTELIHKGVAKDIIASALEEAYEEEDREDAELMAIRKAVFKKIKNIEELGPEEKQKLTASLYRKGFELSKINQVLDY